MLKRKHKSPSTLNSRLKRSKRKHLERPQQPPPNARASIKEELTKAYGLSPDSKFLFFKKGRHYGRPRLLLSFGTVVCLGADTYELLCVVRFINHSSMNEDYHNQLDHAISTVYPHARARGEVKINGATHWGKRIGHKFGRMFAAGFCPGYDPVVKAGT